MKYFFILGNHPALSLAELSAVLGSGNLAANSEEAAVFGLEETRAGLDVVRLMARLGGTIKMGIVSHNSKLITHNLNRESGVGNMEDVLKEIEKLLPMEKKSEGKFKFGISVYGKIKLNEKQLGMEVKKNLKERGISARWVISREKQLSSVVVGTNNLTPRDGETAARGMEIVIMKIGEEIFIGKTLAVQPFRELSFRDYGRPGRDDQSGMLPPKLAQIMINLAGIKTDESDDGNSILLDPFCGSGTVLTEAILMGFQNVIGSDISEKAVADTKRNMEWTKKNFQSRVLGTIFNFQLFNRSATELSKFVKQESVDAIITEPYLGPQRGNVDIRKIKKELESLYGQALREFKKVLKPDGKVVMIWPVFKFSGEWAQVAPDLNGFKIINPLKSPGEPGGFKKGITNRGTLIYGREGQKVWREIVVLKKDI
ncbi:MAG: methyltransferase domain-containing protein [Patescibacteria group bacterium]|jgi:tRNA G10  N-methylase Trm11